MGCAHTIRFKVQERTGTQLTVGVLRGWWLLVLAPGVKLGLGTGREAGPGRLLNRLQRVCAAGTFKISTM